MHNFKLVKDYRDIDTYRRSFNDLTLRTYGFDFENWYKQGYWSGAYTPYSFTDGGKIIANVSVNEMHLVIDDTDFRAIQLGTVMTDEAYRNRGLSRELMNIIIASSVSRQSNAGTIMFSPLNQMTTTRSSSAQTAP